MKKKSMNLITAVAVLVVLSGAYVGVKTYVAKQEEKENAEEEEEKTRFSPFPPRMFSQSNL